MALTMCLEGLAVLLNADVALDPTLPLAQRRVNDCPVTAEASALVAAVLACLPNLGGESEDETETLTNCPIRKLIAWGSSLLLLHTEYSTCHVILPLKALPRPKVLSPLYIRRK